MPSPAPRPEPAQEADSTRNSTDLFAGYLSEEEVAKQEGVGVEALRWRRRQGRSAPWIKSGRRVLYPIKEYREYLAAQLRKPVRGKANTAE
jgi:hypothetical protein